MFFNKDRPEEVCGASCFLDEYPEHTFACLRIKGHGGEHEALARDAEIMDGVCHGCFNPLYEDHVEDCFKLSPPRV